MADHGLPGEKRGGALAWLKNFDVFPKTLDDAKEVTASGGTLSIVVIFSVLILLFSETSLFMKTQTKHEMEVDVVRGGLLKINFDITFTRLPCSVLSLDAMDVSGEHELDVVHDVYKRKVNKEGLPYGEVMSQKVDHARDQGAIQAIKGQLGEGCNIYGTLQAQKVAGNFHFSLHAQDFHVLSSVFEDRSTVNTSHVINHLSFGPFLSEQAWMVLPPHIAASVGSLDDKEFHSDQHIPTTHEHYVKVVRHEVTPPSSWKAQPVTSYGYVAHSNNIQKAGEVPTVRLAYDILPIVVHLSEKKQAFYHFITQLCAIVGGVFTVAGIVASLMDKGINAMKIKQELGKLG
mmetsp:Transcript_9578/g.22515  ORF Transcript_9578/g.22515 Transcript_9578/m.22515 type:complete len:346 (-) Transcript_9578:91-1128(-)